MNQEKSKGFPIGITLTVAAIAVLAVLFYVAGDFSSPKTNVSDEQVSKITAPVGTVVVATEDIDSMQNHEDVMEIDVAVDDTGRGVDASAKMPEVAALAAAANTDLGETVYNGLCKNCHSVAAMASMIPQRGDEATWKARIAKGMDALYSNAINGFTGTMGMMPAKGGNPALSDDEIKAAVDYMISGAQ